MSFFRKFLPFIILLAAFFIRAHDLINVPPGLTHDEAGQVHDAIYILKGVTLIYFPISYGCEPLFAYTNSCFVAGLGANILTFRFAAVVWGMLTLAVTYRLARYVFDQRVAILSLALMSVSFWQLSTSKQILRSAILPVTITLSVFFFLKLVKENSSRRWWWSLGLAISIGASLYTYIPSRALWLMFPLAVATYYIINKIRKTPNTLLNLPHVFGSITLGLALSAPMFIYLYFNPGLDQRLGMLSDPLTQIKNGDPSGLINNTREFLFAFFLNGHGDHFLAYTIPGRPLFDPITALLFLGGFVILIIATFQRPILSVLVLWLAIGLAPSFITGPDALTTRIMGAQSILYIIPAIALSRLWLVASLWFQNSTFVVRHSSFVICSLFIALLGFITYRDYFITWGQSPDVRAAYQSTTISMAQSLNSPAVISTVYPTAEHDPYVAEIFTAQETRWIDGRTALLIPNRSSFKLLSPSSTPLHPAFTKHIQPIQTINLRSTDLDSLFTFYSITNYSNLQSPISIFNNALELIDSKWLAASYKPNDAAEILTVWRVTNPQNLGAMHPPAFKTDLNLFTHVLKGNEVYLQRDALDAPSWDWQTGDVILQIHQIAIPGDAAKGEYKVRVGVYDRITGERLMIKDSGEDAVIVSSLTIR